MGITVGIYSDAVIQSRDTGLGRHARELLSGVASQEGIDALHPISAYGDPADSEHRKIQENYSMTFMPGKRRYRALAWYLFGMPSIDRYIPEVDIVHVAELNMPVPTRKPWLVTVHDIGPLSHPHFFTDSGYPWLMKKSLELAAEKASAIISISEATANEIREYLGKDLEITVIPYGISEVFRNEADISTIEQIDNMPPKDTPFFFFAGSLNPRKNMSGILDAFEMVSDRLPHHLVVAGNVGWGHSSTLERFETSRVKDRIHWIGQMNDSQMAALYSRAEALVFPSFFEGFGFPVLEAMSMGCPVITSNLSSMPEVAGGAALLVGPDKPEEIAEAMKKIGLDRETRKSMIEKGKKNAEKYTWDKNVKAAVEVYKRIA